MAKENFDKEQAEATKIYVDNQSTIAMAKNSMFHRRTKHIKIKYHFIQEAETENEIRLVHCNSEDQIANILTKALPKARFETLRTRLGVSNKSAKEEF